ncbi:MAG: sugar phosphate isomerase/epimerase [Acidobacteria bacterium]|nr:sugar phosphate isomerase/epimerase [Acidobacteriota bacterium]
MNLGLVNSVWIGSPLDTAEGIHKTREIGFDSIDVAADPLEIDIVERARIRNACREAGLPVDAVCCAALGIADFNRTVRRFHIDRCMEHLDLVYELEGRILSLGIGEYVWQQQVIPPREQWKWAVEGVRELGEYAAALGLCVAIEMEPWPMSIIHVIEEMNEFLCEVDCPAVRASLDLSRLATAEIAKFAGRIAQVRLECGEGDAMLLAEIQRTGFDGALSVRLRPGTAAGEVAGQVAEAYRRAGRLMREAGVARPASA